MKERLIYTDFLKIIACLAVITIHATAVFITSHNIQTDGWMTAQFYDASCRWAVPIFIMVSGVFILKTNLKKGINMSLKTFKILLVWSVIYFIGNATLKNKLYIFNIDFAETNNFFKGFFNANISAHLWYLYMLIGLYITMPFLKKIIENSTKRELQFFILVGIVVAIVIPTINGFEWFSLYKNFIPKLFLNMFTYFVVYLSLGYYINKYNIDKKYRLIIYILGIISFFSTYYLTKNLSLIDGKINQTFYKYYSINVFFVSVSLFVFFRNYDFNKLGYKINNSIFFIVKNTFGIYLIHQLVLSFLDKLNWNVKMSNPLFSSPIVVLTCFIISLVIIFVINKIKILKKILL